jgi:hypothetical protein
MGGQVIAITQITTRTDYKGDGVRKACLPDAYISDEQHGGSGVFFWYCFRLVPSSLRHPGLCIPVVSQVIPRVEGQPA